MFLVKFKLYDIYIYMLYFNVEMILRIKNVYWFFGLFVRLKREELN